MYNNLVDRRLPQTQSILPIPVARYPTPDVPLGNVINQKNYGIFKKKPKRDDYPTFCNTLPPPPRDQNISYPQQYRECAYIPQNAFDKNSCYLSVNNEQNVVGLFCGGAGGSGNSNFVRGNEFGLDYPINSLPIQKYYASSDQFKHDIIQNESIFYPYYTQSIIKNPEYKSYPYNNTYADNGEPTFVYPYRPLNGPTNM